MNWKPFKSVKKIELSNIKQNICGDSGSMPQIVFMTRLAPLPSD